MKNESKWASLVLCLLAPGALAAAPVAEPSDDELLAYIESMRGSRVLLDPGEVRASASVSAALRGADLGFGTTSTTEYGGGVSLAYGVSKRLEVFSLVPAGQTAQEQRVLDTRASASEGGLGAVVIGARYTLAYEQEGLPELVGSLQVGFPTGSYGERQTTIRGGIDIVATVDPVVFLGGLGVTYGVGLSDVQLDASGGMQLAVSDRVALGAELQWSSSSSTFGDPLKDVATLTGHVSVTYGRNFLEPSIGLGLTSASPDVTVGLSWGRRF